MSQLVTLDRQRNSALYQQIAEQIKDRIGDGRLAAGAQLPTIRQLANDLGVTRLTVQSAYDELQSGGWIEATVGRGTFVSRTIQIERIVERAVQPLTTDSVIQDILHTNHLLGTRSLASASPDPRLFPEEEMWGALSALRGSFASLSTYCSSQGDLSLLGEIVVMLKERGIEAATEDLIITNGATQGFALLIQALCRPGDRVLVEQPTYLGFLHTIKAYGVQPIGVPMDAEGPRLDALERLILQERPRFFYTVPAFQNPTGLNFSDRRRQEMLAVAERLGILLVEDDIYAQLSYDNPVPLPIKHWDTTHTVVHLGSFSKMLMPSLRLGYVIAPAPLHQKILSLRRAADLSGSLLLQHALREFLRNGGLKRHLRRVLPIYRDRRNSLIASLQQTMPAGVQWSHPSGGFSTWVTLPATPAMADLCEAAQKQGWSFAPGTAFLPQEENRQHLRVAFGQASSEVIRTGIEVLARLIRERLARTPAQHDSVHAWMPLV